VETLPGKVVARERIQHEPEETWGSMARKRKKLELKDDHAKLWLEFID
jgi:hypothetical protein